MKVDLSMFYTVDEDGEQVKTSRPETKTWGDLVLVANHHQGKNEAVVNKFIEMYLLGVQWDWYEHDYKNWVAKCEHINELNNNRVKDEETGELPEPYPLPDLQKRPEKLTVADIRKQNPSLFTFVDDFVVHQNKILVETNELVSAYKEQLELKRTPDITEEQYKQTLVFRDQIRHMVRGEVNNEQ